MQLVNIDVPLEAPRVRLSVAVDTKLEQPAKTEVSLETNLNGPQLLIWVILSSSPALLNCQPVISP